MNKVRICTWNVTFTIKETSKGRCTPVTGLTILMKVKIEACLRSPAGPTKRTPTMCISEELGVKCPAATNKPMRIIFQKTSDLTQMATKKNSVTSMAKE